MDDDLLAPNDSWEVPLEKQIQQNDFTLPWLRIYGIEFIGHNWRRFHEKSPDPLITVLKDPINHKNPLWTLPKYGPRDPQKVHSMS